MTGPPEGAGEAAEPQWPEPGWYPDPDGSAWDRYWDGTQWDDPLEPPDDSLPATLVPKRRIPTRGTIAFAIGLVVLGTVYIIVRLAVLAEL